MHTPYYDAPELCAVLCFLFTAIAFALGLGCWRAWRLAPDPGMRWWERPRSSAALALVGALLPAPTAFFVEVKGPRLWTPPLLCAGAALVVLAVARLRGWRASALIIVGGGLAIAWAALAPSNSIEALFSFWMVVGAACFGGPLVDDTPSKPSSAVRSHAHERMQNACIALLGGAVAYASTRWITEGFVGSADEWANEYQAALFAKGKLYGQRWPCFDALRMFFVFWEGDRTFSQYTPGFPAFLAPFVRLGISPYVGVPVLAAGNVGVARLARRFASPQHRAAAGPVAALVFCLSTAVVNMAGTRYPHLLVVTCFLLVLDATCTLLARHAAGQRAIGPALVLGLAAGLALTARPQDGLFLGAGPAVVLLWAAVRRRVGLLPLGIALGMTSLLVAAMLVVLHAQIGAWFRTGYDLNARILPWAQVHYSLPPLKMLKWPLPWLVGGATWLPLSPVLAAAGCAAACARREDARVNRPTLLAMAISCAALLLYYACSELGRGSDMGPSPRYQFFLVGPMAVGTALFLLEILGSVPRALARRAVWLFAALGTAGLLWFVAPNAFSPMRYHARSRSPAQYVARNEDLHGAVIFAESGSGTSSEWDWPQNRPLELYEPDNVYALWGSAIGRKCVQQHWPDRPVYRVDHWDKPAIPVRPVPMPTP